MRWNWLPIFYGFRAIGYLKLQKRIDEKHGGSLPRVNSDFPSGFGILPS